MYMTKKGIAGWFKKMKKTLIIDSLVEFTS